MTATAATGGLAEWAERSAPLRADLWVPKTYATRRYS
jgi:hypothetical protein